MSQNKIILPIIFSQNGTHSSLTLILSPSNYDEQFNNFVTEHGFSVNQILLLKHRVEQQIERMVMTTRINEEEDERRKRINQRSGLRTREQPEESLMKISRHEEITEVYEYHILDKNLEKKEIREQNIENDRQSRKSTYSLNISDSSQDHRQDSQLQKEIQREKREYSERGFQTEVWPINLVNEETQTPKYQEIPNIYAHSELRNKIVQPYQSVGQTQVIKPIRRNLHHDYQEQSQPSQKIRSSGGSRKFQVIPERNQYQPRKIVFLENLQNYQEPRTVQKKPHYHPIHQHQSQYPHYEYHHHSPPQHQISPKISQKQGIEISQRLYSNKTQAFSSKKSPDRNPKEEQDYREIQNYLLNRAEPSINYFQDMSKKTTASSRRKNEPQPQFEEQIEQTLPPLPKSKRQKMKESSSYQLQGRKCESRQIKERLQREEEQRKKREKQIRQRLKKKLQYKEQSVSPASKSSPKSRKCRCCDEQSRRNDDAECTFSPKINKNKLTPKSNEVNRKYVSRVLNETFKQFENQLRSYH